MDVVTACAFISEQPSTGSSEDSAQHGHDLSEDAIVAVVKPSAFISNQTAMSLSDSVQHSPRTTDDVVMEVIAPSKAITNQLVTGSLHVSVYFSPASSQNENLVISLLSLIHI